MLTTRKYLFGNFFKNFRSPNEIADCFAKKLCSTSKTPPPLTPPSPPPCANRTCFMSPSCKVALVNGGAEGMGYAVANHLLKSGARGVCITGLNKTHGKEAVKCLNGQYGSNRAIFVNLNVNCMSQLEETFKVTKETYDNIDIVVNCCAICDGPKWENEIVTNVVGTIRTLLLAFKYVGKEGCGRGGCVVNFSGTGGLIPMAPVPTLSSTYHAIVGLSRSFGDKKHEESSGLRVVCLCPGVTSTQFFSRPTEQAMTPKMGNHLAECLKGAKVQNADVAGLAAIDLIKYAPTGSVWVVEGSRLFECNIPQWESYSKLFSQYL